MRELAGARQLPGRVAAPQLLGHGARGVAHRSDPRSCCPRPRCARRSTRSSPRAPPGPTPSAWPPSRRSASAPSPASIAPSRTDTGELAVAEWVDGAVRGGAAQLRRVARRGGGLPRGGARGGGRHPAQPARPAGLAGLHLRGSHRGPPRDGRHRGHRGAAGRRAGRRGARRRGPALRLERARGPHPQRRRVHDGGRRCARASTSSSPRTCSAGCAGSATRASSARPSRGPRTPSACATCAGAPREPPLVLRGVLEVASHAGAPAPLPRRRGALGRRLLPARAHRLDQRPFPVAAAPRDAGSGPGRPLARRAAHAPARHGRRHGLGPVARGYGAAVLRRRRRGPTRSTARAGARRAGTASADRVRACWSGARARCSSSTASGFVPFSPPPELEEHETVVATIPQGKQIGMLVCGDDVGAVARFDGRKLDAHPREPRHRGTAGRSRRVARRGHRARPQRRGLARRRGPPRPVIWDTRQAAFISDIGAPAPRTRCAGSTAARCSPATGASSRSAPATPCSTPRPTAHEPARLARVGGGATTQDRRRQPPGHRRHVRQPRLDLALRPRRPEPHRRSRRFLGHRRARLVITLPGHGSQARDPAAERRAAGRPPQAA